VSATTRTAFRAVHPDFRSSRGYVWPFPGGTAEASGPFTGHTGGCPQAPGDGICLAHTWAGVASGGIPAIAVLVCEYDEADLLGFEGNPGLPEKVRVTRARVLRVVDFPTTLRGDVPRDEALPYEDLGSADLRSANLVGADLRGAYLRGANLVGADLDGANLADADLRGAYLRGAYLRGANLADADLRGAYLRGAYLRGANLVGADLRGAYLRGANLGDADLRGADLGGANLADADLRGASANRYTVWPAGFDPVAAGAVVS